MVERARFSQGRKDALAGVRAEPLQCFFLARHVFSQDLSLKVCSSIFISPKQQQAIIVAVPLTPRLAEG